jgi:uncharacterized phiE125 gp8 family phage protein
MEVRETSSVPSVALPIAAFRDHLRLGSGFVDDTTQDGLLEAYLRAAIAAVEGRVSKVLLTRNFVLSLARWRDGYAQALPVAPVRAITGMTTIGLDLIPVTVDTNRYHLEVDAHRPRLVANGALLPNIPTGGAVEIAFEAGFGGTWAEVPADLAQAVFLLGAKYYEHRAGEGADAELPFGVMALIERWRSVRMFGGMGR